jgi:hypothetical protein
MLPVPMAVIPSRSRPGLNATMIGSLSNSQATGSPRR